MSVRLPPSYNLFFFNDTRTTEIYTLPLHDALPIWEKDGRRDDPKPAHAGCLHRSDRAGSDEDSRRGPARSEEHTSELQSPDHLVCRLLLEKKKKLTSPIDLHKITPSPSKTATSPTH